MELSVANVFVNVSCVCVLHCNLRRGPLFYGSIATLALFHFLTQDVFD